MAEIIPINMCLNFTFLNEIKFFSENKATITKTNMDTPISIQKLNGFSTNITNHNIAAMINEKIITLFLLSCFSKALPPFYKI